VNAEPSVDSANDYLPLADVARVPIPQTDLGEDESMTSPVIHLWAIADDIPIPVPISQRDLEEESMSSLVIYS
jgi:hypothetical protein